MIRKLRIFLWKKLLRFYPWWLQKVYGVNIGKDVIISWKSTIDKNINPTGVYIGDRTEIVGGVIVLAHDFGRRLKLDTKIEEECYIGMRSIILPGVTIGRGATVGAGSVVSTNVPPYSVVMGNPAKVISFKMKPQEIVEYEKSIYPEDKRLPLDVLEKNYKKYYTDRIKIIIDNLK